MSAALPKTRQAWLQALENLPSTPDRIPAFFFTHGSPMLAYPASDLENTPIRSLGQNGPLGSFLKDFGPVLLKKYRPKGIAVFSAHWATDDTRVVSDYGDENPLLYDYYGFEPELYQLKFRSRGDSKLSQRIVELYKTAGFEARTTTKEEPRGEDGRDGFPAGSGIDHGVFIPFRLMFGTETDIPIVQISIDSSFDLEKHWAIGKAVSALRHEGILVLSGGWTIHNLSIQSSLFEERAEPIFHAFDRAVLDAVQVKNPVERKLAMMHLARHPAYELATYPKPDHFVPLCIAAGAGDPGAMAILVAPYGAGVFAFGL